MSRRLQLLYDHTTARQCPPQVRRTAQPVEGGRSSPLSTRTSLSVCSSPRLWRFNMSETLLRNIPVLNSVSVPFVFRLTTHGCQSYKVTIDLVAIFLLCPSVLCQCKDAGFPPGMRLTLSTQDNLRTCCTTWASACPSTRCCPSTAGTSCWASRWPGWASSPRPACEQWSSTPPLIPVF